MTHSFRADQEVLPRLLSSDVGYVGVLGPRRRTERLLEPIPWPLPSLREGGAGDGLFAPLGLDIGADNPEEIALSLVAEIRAWATGRDGRSLRLREGPIH